MTNKPARSDRLPPDQVEHVLQGIRPRPSRLIAEAVLERSAARDPRSPRLRPGRPVSTIVTSWSCGAAVGALTTYLVMLTLAPSVSRPDTIAPSAPVTQPRMATDQSPPRSSLAASQPQDVVSDQPQDEHLIAFEDPFWGVRTSMPPGGYSLRVGLYLDPNGGRGEHPEVTPRMAGHSLPFVGKGHRPEASRPAGGDRRERADPFLDSPRMTRQRMLAELIGEGS